MSQTKYKIWCNNLFTATQKNARTMLIDGIGDHEISIFETAENGKQGDSNEFLKNADIAFGSPDAEALFSCKNLRWVQVSSAGYPAYDRDDLREFLRNKNVILTNSSAVYEEFCAQHLLAMILSFMRCLPLALDNQRGEKAWLLHEMRSNIRISNSQTVLILGFGAIGRRLVQMLKPLKMKVIGVKRTIRGDEPIKVISETEVDEFLPETDHLVNILPANDSTTEFLNAARLAKLKRGAFVYNIGRGTTVNQKALVENLIDGHLKGAYLDVTEPEPLPPDDQLWTTPNCYITTHVAGGHSQEKEMQVVHFLNNLRLFEREKNLINRLY